MFEQDQADLSGMAGEDALDEAMCNVEVQLEKAADVVGEGRRTDWVGQNPALIHERAPFGVDQFPGGLHQHGGGQEVPRFADFIGGQLGSESRR